MAPPIRAVLLVGPTGSGKSPVGARLEQAGGFHHFDFGAELRAAARGERGLAPADVAYVQGVLEAQALLPDERFPIAEELLRRFLRRRGFEPSADVLVLNGLPRHVGQARALAATVRVEAVAVLECDAAAAHARVASRRRGEGPDHAGRPDDAPEAVARKLARYARETEPLVAHYAAQSGVRVLRIPVGAETAEEAIAAEIARSLLQVGGANGKGAAACCPLE